MSVVVSIWVLAFGLAPNAYQATFASVRDAKEAEIRAAGLCKRSAYCDVMVSWFTTRGVPVGLSSYHKVPGREIRCWHPGGIGQLTCKVDGDPSGLWPQPKVVSGESIERSASTESPPAGSR